QGMASNLTAKVEDQYAHGRYAHVTERAEAPIEEALSLIVRERLTGLKPPASAQALVDIWRPWIEERAATTLERMGDAASSQTRFGRLMRNMLRDLELSEELADGEKEEGESDDEQQPDGGESDTQD